MYIQSATLNGQNWDKYWLSHKTFVNGGKLEIILKDKPNKLCGSYRDKGYL